MSIKRFRIAPRQLHGQRHVATNWRIYLFSGTESQIELHETGRITELVPLCWTVWRRYQQSEYTLDRPPNCPTKWDRLTSKKLDVPNDLVHEWAKGVVLSLTEAFADSNTPLNEQDDVDENTRSALIRLAAEYGRISKSGT
jgi:hypothetical protein